MDTLSRIKEKKIVSIIRNVKKNDVLKIADVLKESGIEALEITLNTPNALESIEELTKKFGDKLIIGAGSVLDEETARISILKGAKFILSPTLNVKVIEVAKRYGVVSVPGTFTPTEILTAYEHGADIVKVFPIPYPKYIKDIHGPLAQIPLMAVGGVNNENARDFIEQGAAALGIGSSLVSSKKVDEKYLYELSIKAKNLVQSIK